MNAYDFSRSYTSLSNEKIEEKVKNIVSSYPDDLEDTLAAELIAYSLLHMWSPRNL